MTNRKAAAIIGIAGLGIGIAIAATGLSPQVTLVAFSTVAATAVVLTIAARSRSSIGAGIGLARYVALWLTGIATLLITFNAVRVGPHVTASDFVLLAAVSVSLFSLTADGTPIPRIPGWLLVAGCGLLTAGFLATFSTDDVGGSMVATGEFALALVGVPVLLAFSADSLPRLLLIAKLWFGSALLNSVVALTDFLHVTSVGIVLGERPSGLSVHPNHLGMAAAMTLPVGVLLATRTGKSIRSAVYFAAVAIVVLGVLVSGSRAALLGAIAGIVLVLLLGRRMWKPVILVAVLGVALFVVSSTSPSSDQTPSTTNPFIAIERLTKEASTGESNSLRLQYYREALSEFSDHPLTGIGFTVVRAAHDIYFQLLAAGGISALLSFTVFAMGALRTGLRISLRRQLNNEMRNLAAALTAGLMVWLLAALVQNLIYDRYLYVPIGLLIGLQIAARREATSAESP